jgi:hypothetical protein
MSASPQARAQRTNCPVLRRARIAVAKLKLSEDMFAAVNPVTCFCVDCYKGPDTKQAGVEPDVTQYGLPIGCVPPRPPRPAKCDACAAGGRTSA